MMVIDAKKHDWQELNRIIRDCREDITVENCCGERFIACGMSGKTVTINGVPGNALGAYLSGGVVIATQNVQDAVGDTMDEGKIIVHADAGDALGYAMRGGKIFIKGNSGYRTGIHMKQYLDKRPVIVVGGRTGSFLGEYIAGGLIIVLGIGCSDVPSGNFIGTGMHGGQIWLRTEAEPENLPAQVNLKRADTSDLSAIAPYVREFCEYFDTDPNEILNHSFYCLTPNAKNPYRQLYTQN